MQFMDILKNVESEGKVAQTLSTWWEKKHRTLTR